jgi:GT2 family glycosyltransferase
MEPPVSDAPAVSVVIITRNRVEPFGNCIRSILDNGYDDLELVILDNGSDESAASLSTLLGEAGERVRLTYRRTAPSGFAAMRREAVGLARGEFIVSIDDDCVLGENAIAFIVERFRSDSSIGIVGGNIENVGFSGADRYKGRGRIGINGRYEPVEDPADAEVFGSANKSIRRSVYDMVGGYDPFFASGMEEADLALSVKRAGFDVVYEPRVRITHYHSPGRFRGRWANLNVVRLYLFFKHFMPSGAAGWLGFLRREWLLLLDDISKLSLSARVEAGAGGYLYASLLVAHDLLKIIIARAAIPYLAFRAWRKRPA